MLTTRRTILHMLAAAPLLASGSRAQARDESLIARLIHEAQSRGSISERIDFISRALLGVRYQADTLIGGSRRTEVLVIRADAFDCVTFCEVVLAAALAKGLSEFEPLLRRIRYEQGEVRWDQRNHHFADWSRRAVENGICRSVAIGPSVPIAKVVQEPGLAKRRVSLSAIASATMLKRPQLLKSGDIIGFVSRRSYLDFFHTGFLIVAPKGNLLLRHASQSRGRVLDEPLKEFIAANGTQHVTLLRAEEPSVARM